MRNLILGIICSTFLMGCEEKKEEQKPEENMSQHEREEKEAEEKKEEQEKIIEDLRKANEGQEGRKKR